MLVLASGLRQGRAGRILAGIGALQNRFSWRRREAMAGQTRLDVKMFSSLVVSQHGYEVVTKCPLKSSQISRDRHRQG